MACGRSAFGVLQLRSAQHGRGDLLRTEPRPRRRREGWRGQDDDERGAVPDGRPGGKSVLLVELEGKSGIAAAFGRREDLGYEEVVLLPPGGTAAGTAGSVRARRLTPDDALIEYLEDHGLRRVSKRLARSGVFDVVADRHPRHPRRPGPRQGQAARARRRRRPDRGRRARPPGHAITFLTSASGLLERGPGRAAPHPGPGRRRPAHRPDPLPGPPGHPARGAAGVRDDRVGLHPRGQGRRAAGAGHRERLRPRPGRAGPPVRRGGRRGRRARSTRSTWWRWRRPAASAWPATPSRPSRSSGWRRELPLPHLVVPGARRAVDRARRRPTPWPTHWPGRSAAWWPRGRREHAGGERRGRCSPACGDARDLVADAGRRGVLRLGRGRQDDRVGHVRPGGGAGGAARLRRHRRPGAPPGRRAGRGVAAQHALRGARATGPATCTR